jgi:hypothetical protein
MIVASVIVGRGGAAAVFELLTGGGAWLGLLAGVLRRRISQPSDKRER